MKISDEFNRRFYSSIATWLCDIYLRRLLLALNRFMQITNTAQQVWPTPTHPTHTPNSSFDKIAESLPIAVLSSDVTVT
jgi:hypothetical protein